MPTDIGVIDLMMGIPSGDPKRWYDFLRTQLLDRESREDFEFPAEYMFKNVPHFEEHWDDPVAYLLSEMDKHGIAKAMVGSSFKNDQAQNAIKEHPDRFFGSFEVPRDVEPGRYRVIARTPGDEKRLPTSSPR